jgi:hypothetical protein
MLSNSERYSGTNYTTTAALLLAAFVVDPVLLYVSWPVDDGTMILALGGALALVGLAWRSWRNASELSVPTISAPVGRGR